MALGLKIETEMAKILLVLTFYFIEAFAYGGTYAEWPGWRISTSENIYDDRQKYEHYPSPLMFDGDPSTAWVFSGDTDLWRLWVWKPLFGEGHSEKPLGTISYG